MTTVRIRQQTPGAPLPAVVDDEDIKTKMEQVIRQFGILYVAFNATWTDDDDTIVFFA